MPPKETNKKEKENNINLNLFEPISSKQVEKNYKLLEELLQLDNVDDEISREEENGFINKIKRLYEESKKRRYHYLENL